MFFLNFSNIWSFSFFFILTYITIFMSLLIYLLPIFLSSTNLNSSAKVKNNFYIISTNEVMLFLFIPFLCILFLNMCWSSSDLSIWFGHLIFSSFQSKMVYFIFFMFYLVLYFISSLTYFSSSEIYDFIITKFNFLYWITILFMSNSIFTLMFIIEVISTLIFLLITTSVFSTAFFYKNINFDSKNFFQNLTPFTFLHSLFFFFWISLISSLNLFVFIIFIYKSLITLDWFLLEHIFYYLTNISNFKNLFLIGISWFFIIFSIFLKCGIAPLFIWKPTFFKGLSFTTLIFYISFFYFFLFLFLILFLTNYMHSLFYYYFLINLLFIALGLVNLFFILCESFYIKTFFAISSILNSLFVMLAIVSNHNLDFFFFYKFL